MELMEFDENRLGGTAKDSSWHHYSCFLSKNNQMIIIIMAG